MKGTVLVPPKRGVVKKLDRLLLRKDGALRACPARVLDNFNYDDLRVWCHLRGVYGIPTEELVACLRSLTLSHSCLEIGAGRSCVGRSLGWTCTDNLMQTWPEIQQFYALQGQPCIQYPEGVLEMDALDAVDTFKPSCVFGSWVTSWIDPEKPMPPEGGNMYGVKEPEIWSRPWVKMYIVYGNECVHGRKPLLREPHETLRAPWMWSRAINPEDNVLYIWRKA